MSSYPIVLKDEFSTVIFLHQRILYGVRSVLAYPIKTIMILNTGTRLYNRNDVALLAHFSERPRGSRWDKSDISLKKREDGSQLPVQLFLACSQAVR